MRCECKSQAKVIDTRHSKDTTYRKLVCDGCGKTFYTMEFTVEEDEQFKKEWKRLAGWRYKKNEW